MTTLEKIRTELHATAEMHEDGDYYLRDKWVDEVIDKYAAEQEPETVTEFADRCRECGAIYGKLLKQQSCNYEDAMAKEYAKAFHFGMALGFGVKYDEMGKIIEEVKKAVKESEVRNDKSANTKLMLMEANINGYTQGLRDAAPVHEYIKSISKPTGEDKNGNNSK